MGTISGCFCGRPNTDAAGFKWKGCSDNIEYGRIVSSEWADAPWAKYTRRKQRKSIRLGSQLADGVVRNKISMNQFMNPDDVLSPRMKMNQHNNEVGRQIVKDRRMKKCSCHGTSQACTIKTCWESLPTLTVIGEALAEKYVQATEVKQASRRGGVVGVVGVGGGREGGGGGGRRTLEELAEFETVAQAGKVTHSDLVYIRKSPDYCTEDHRVGSLGTKGRECNATATTHANCDSMCCGRGHDTTVQEKEENCECKYVHCCYVKCKLCKTTIQKHFCK